MKILKIYIKTFNPGFREFKIELSGASCKLYNK